MQEDKKIPIVLVGHFPPSWRKMEEGSSIAGNQVQRRILSEIERLEVECINVKCYSMTPMPCWPRGTLLSRSEREESIEFIGYLNLPIIKHIVFSARLAARLLVSKPRLCLQYNSYLFENLGLIVLRLLRRSVALAIIIQDVNYVRENQLMTRAGLKSILELASLSAAKHFDVIVPISSSIVSDFGICPAKSFIFQGGITDYAEELIAKRPSALDDIAVFAGALERHNGVDRLIDYWLRSDVRFPLHILGRGSLELRVAEAASRSDRIVFHGFQSEGDVLRWQMKARWNLCLRYSDDINQKYFFPSKLFNILCAPGMTIVNDFDGLNGDLKKYLHVVKDDLSDLANVLLSTADLLDAAVVDRRREALRLNCSWASCIKRIVEFSGILAGS